MSYALAPSPDRVSHDRTHTICLDNCCAHVQTLRVFSEELPPRTVPLPRVLVKVSGAYAEQSPPDSHLRGSPNHDLYSSETKLPVQACQHQNQCKCIRGDLSKAIEPPVLTCKEVERSGWALAVVWLL
jgi:hypothetical protein